MRSPSVGAGSSRLEPQRTPRDMRLYVRLDPNDRLLLNERAAARGMPAATYAAVLVRSGCHLPRFSMAMRRGRRKV